ncbi:MAG: class I SAM-dependent methyltransferase [Bacillota bacterium]
MTRPTPERIIKDEIRKRGRITFAEYMEMALYHPEAGYYIMDREKIGLQGDFYTSPDVSPLFGKVLADQAEEMWRLSGRPDSWALVEFGAGKGFMARDIISQAGERHKDFHSAMSYVIIDKSPYMIKGQKETLRGVIGPGRGITWLEGLEKLKPESVVGCFLSNELIDAFPVHRVIKKDGEYREIYVTCEGGSIAEEAGVPSSSDLIEYINDFGIEMEDEQAIEINLAVRDWLEGVSRALCRGFILTIDYGDTAGRLFSPMRHRGTIRSYRRHRLADSLYDCPGDQDITASVNFTALMRWGEEVGLMTAGYASQSHFLMNLGILNYLKPQEQGAGFDHAALRETMAVKKLIMPEGMGSVFKVLAQQKGFEGGVNLSGFSGRFGSRR